MNIFEKSRNYIYRNARPIDLARWQYHFEDGSKQAVLNALSFYQNEDGGFGHALEADCWNPNSSPIQTWTATEILHEINFTDVNHSIIQGILKYLASGKDFENNFWYNSIKSNNDYPHAPWWQAKSCNTSNNNYNPTACLAGFIIRFADEKSDLFKLGCHIVKEAYESYMDQDILDDMHTVLCYIRLAEYIENAEKNDIIDLTSLKLKLVYQVSNSITKNKSKWENSYICKPSQFFNSKDSIFYDDNKEIAEYECEFINKTQLSDGSWLIPWDWNDYPEQWVISKNWWKSHSIIVNMIYLKEMGNFQF